MKKKLLTVFALLMAGAAFSQTIPNGGFENWTSHQYEEPTNFQTSNSSDNNGVLNPNNTIKTTDAYHGTYAIQLNTILVGGDTSFAFFANGDPGQMPAQGGIPYTQKPTGFRLHYKSNIIGTDSAIMLAIFKKTGAEIGRYIYKISASQSNYTLFSTLFSPALAVNPDTVVFASASSNVLSGGNGTPGNMFQIDSVFFTGVASQPVGFNGDFENWQTHTTNLVNGWTLDGGNGVTQTTDRYTGAYALELQTMGPSFGGSNQVQPAQVLTGKTVQNSSPAGGYTYANQVDTLVFYYKYIPADPTDSANISISFSKNGVGMGGIRKILGTAAGTYSMVTMTYSLNQVPDTALISISSSNYTTWPYPNSFVGSDLKIDNMYLASQKKPVTNFSMPLTGCVGDSIQLTDSSLNMVTGWQWIMGGGSPPNSNAENPKVKYTSVGSHTVSMIATNSFGNGVQIYKHITIYALPVVSTNSPIVCQGTQATFTASGAITYTWSTGANTATISATPTTTATYTVTGTDANGCKGSDVESATVLTAPIPNICMVTADDSSINNIIYYDKTLYANVDSFIAYRETSSNVYKRIGAQRYSALSQFIDTARSVGGPNGGNPNTGTYRYKLQTVDTCGNYSLMSPYHNTIFITHNGGQFSWATPYQIEGQATPDTNYVLTCDTANTNVWTPVASVSGSQQTVADPGYIHHANIANWRVDALGFNCNPTQRLASGNNSVYSAKIRSHSNQNNNRQAGIKQIVGNSEVTIYPNPATNILNIGFATTTAKASIKITSLLGSEVLGFNQTISGNSLVIDINTLASGTYLVHITTDNISEIKKIVKQ